MAGVHPAAIMYETVVVLSIWAAMYASHFKRVRTQPTVAVLTSFHQQTLAGRPGRWRLILSPTSPTDLPDRPPLSHLARVMKQGLAHRASQCHLAPNAPSQTEVTMREHVTRDRRRLKDYGQITLTFTVTVTVTVTVTLQRRPNKRYEPIVIQVPETRQKTRAR